MGSADIRDGMGIMGVGVDSGDFGGRTVPTGMTMYFGVGYDNDPVDTLGPPAVTTMSTIAGMTGERAYVALPPLSGHCPWGSILFDRYGYLTIGTVWSGRNPTDDGKEGRPRGPAMYKSVYWSYNGPSMS